VGWSGAFLSANVFSILSLVIGGYPVLKSAIKALFIPDLNVDTLVSIAAIAATSSSYRGCCRHFHHALVNF
jgi:cation transport ATPase